MPNACGKCSELINSYVGFEHQGFENKKTNNLFKIS